MSRILSTLAPSAFSLEFVLCIFASAGDAIFLPLLCMPLARCRGDRRVEGRGMGGHYYEWRQAAIYRWSTNGGGSSNRSSRTGACNNLRFCARVATTRRAITRRRDVDIRASWGAASSAPTAYSECLTNSWKAGAVCRGPTAVALAVEEGVEASVASAAYRELCAVCEHGDV